MHSFLNVQFLLDPFGVLFYSLRFSDKYPNQLLQLSIVRLFVYDALTRRY